MTLFKTLLTRLSAIVGAIVVPPEVLWAAIALISAVVAAGIFLVLYGALAGDRGKDARGTVELILTGRSPDRSRKKHRKKIG